MYSIKTISIVLSFSLLGCCTTCRNQPQSLLGSLKNSEYRDRMNATAWNSDNPTLDNYYAYKDQQVKQIIEQLGKGEEPPIWMIEETLDNSEANRWGDDRSAADGHGYTSISYSAKNQNTKVRGSGRRNPTLSVGGGKDVMVIGIAQIPPPALANGLGLEGASFAGLAHHT